MTGNHDNVPLLAATRSRVSRGAAERGFPSTAERIPSPATIPCPPPTVKQLVHFQDSPRTSLDNPAPPATSMVCMEPTANSDAELVAETLAGDRQAFGQLY